MQFSSFHKYLSQFFIVRDVASRLRVCPFHDVETFNARLIILLDTVCLRIIDPPQVCFYVSRCSFNDSSGIRSTLIALILHQIANFLNIWNINNLSFSLSKNYTFQRIPVVSIAKRMFRAIKIAISENLLKISTHTHIHTYSIQLFHNERKKKEKKEQSKRRL